MADPYVVSAAGAAWDAAHAAWAGVVVNALVVASAFAVQWNQARIERNRHRQDDVKIDAAARKACVDLARMFHAMADPDHLVEGRTATVADVMASVRVRRAVLLHVLDRHPAKLEVVEAVAGFADMAQQFADELEALDSDIQVPPGTRKMAERTAEFLDRMQADLENHPL